MNSRLITLDWEVLDALDRQAAILVNQLLAARETIDSLAGEVNNLRASLILAYQVGAEAAPLTRPVGLDPNAVTCPNCGEDLDLREPWAYCPSCGQPRVTMAELRAALSEPPSPFREDPPEPAFPLTTQPTPTEEAPSADTHVEDNPAPGGPTPQGPEGAPTDGSKKSPPKRLPRGRRTTS